MHVYVDLPSFNSKDDVCVCVYIYIYIYIYMRVYLDLRCIQLKG